MKIKSSLTIFIIVLLTGIYSTKIAQTENKNTFQIPNPVACQQGDERVALLLVGSYHMANPGLDQFNLNADDVTTVKRQAEIQALVETLAAFEPTKIAVEAQFGDSTAQNQYLSYLNNEAELAKNESQQIGFRLAKIMGHESIYPIDYPLSLNSNNLGPLVANNPEFQKYMQGVQQTGSEAMQLMGTWLSEGTVSSMLYNMNKPEIFERGHTLYIEYILPIVEGENYAGADMVSRWYQRNIFIFSNLHKISDSNSDRILVIYGLGHIPILKQLATDSPHFCLEDPLSYINPN